MGQARRKLMAGSNRRLRFIHLMMFISRFNKFEITRFADRRKL
jgi:hypothetical protein